MNLKETVMLKRLNTMRARYVMRLREIADCQCPLCVARRSNVPIMALLRHLGDDEPVEPAHNVKAH